AAAPAFGQQPPASSSADTKDAKGTKDAKDKDKDKPLDLPVSLDKIREALQQPVASPLKGLDERPTFRIQIRERQKLDDLLKSMKLDGGPPIPPTLGGVYGYEQQRLMFNPVDNPLAQPWSAFTPGQLAMVSATSFVEVLLARFLAKRLSNAITTTERAQ